ncbi:hypothetical protein, partial [Streptomyces violaceorubidus]|uniref:hypothetical protein n=1 Tax=Streptomyces violaceorubidus TaxID=284042 RepID=UPI001ADF17D3
RKSTWRSSAKTTSSHVAPGKHARPTTGSTKSKPAAPRCRETRQTYQWLNKVKAGSTLVPQVYLDEMHAANVPNLDNARATEDQKKRTPEEHMEILRKNKFVLSTVGDTQQTYQWFNSVKAGRTMVPQVYLDEMHAANVPGLDDARATENKKKRTPEEHMEILRKNNFRPSTFGETHQTYDWFNSVKLGKNTVPQVYLDEMHAANVPGLDNARATEDQKKLTAEKHMEILRKNKFVLSTVGDTQQTYQWFSDVKSGRTTVPQVYLDEMRAANIPDLDNARATEDQKKLTAEKHMEILRKNKFVLSTGGDAQQTYQWFKTVKSGRITVPQVRDA